MCYRISIPGKDSIEKAYNPVKVPVEWKAPAHHANAFDYLKTPVIASPQSDLIQLFDWGLIPYWIRDANQAETLRAQTHNAKAETVFDKPAFRESIERRRCLVIVDGFYEWQHVIGKKYPYFIYAKDQEPFSLGGVYDSWVNCETGEVINSYSIITTEANTLLAKIHNSKLRMPLVIPKAQERIWIAPELSKQEIQDLMRPAEEAFLEAHTISKLITSRNDNPDVPEVKEPFHYSELDENKPPKKESQGLLFPE